MLEVRHLCKSYGTKEVLQDISFTIPSGTICGLVGKMVPVKQPFSIPYCVLSATRERLSWISRLSRQLCSKKSATCQKSGASCPS